MTGFLARAAAALALGVLFLSAFDTISVSAQTTPSPDLRDDQFATAYQINPAHSGGITFDQSFAPPLKVLWNDTAEGPMSYPLIARGKVFVWVSHSTDLHQIAGRLYALDKTSGMVLWQADLAAEQGNATIAYDEGRVFVLTWDGALMAFDADSGVQQWSVQLPTSFAFGPPLAANGRIFVGASTADETQGTLFAIDETSGSTLWSQALSSPASGVGALSGQGVFVDLGCGLAGFNPVTGTALSPAISGRCGGPGWTPVYYRGFVYESDAIPPFNFGGLIFDANAASGGSFGVGFSVQSGLADLVPAFQGSAGYFMAVDSGPNGDVTGSGSFVAFDYRSGTTLWSNVVAAGSLVPPLVVNDTVYGLDLAGTLHAYDRVSGAEIWNASGGTPPDDRYKGPPLAGMAAGEGVLVVPVGRQLYALVPASGE